MIYIETNFRVIREIWRSESNKSLINTDIYFNTYILMTLSGRLILCFFSKRRSLNTFCFMWKGFQKVSQTRPRQDYLFLSMWTTSLGLLCHMLGPLEDFLSEASLPSKDIEQISLVHNAALLQKYLLFINP